MGNVFDETHKMILLVSDNMVDIRKIERSLMDMGGMATKVHVCHTVKEAAHKVTVDKVIPAVLIFDTRLRNTVDPREAVDVLKELAPKVPMIVLAGDTEEEKDMTMLLIREGALGHIDRDGIVNLPGMLRDLIFGRE